MTYLERLKAKELSGEDEERVRYSCPADYFGVPSELCSRTEAGPSGVADTENVKDICHECWNREYDVTNLPREHRSKSNRVLEDSHVVEMLEAMQHSTVPKRRIVAEIATMILESEAFMSAYPFTTDMEQIKRILTRFLKKNRVSTENGRALLRQLAESYLGI